MRPLVLAALVPVFFAGCAGGTPENVRARWAARKWTKQHLHPSTLRVSQLQWERDRAVVALTADTRKLTLRLRETDGAWHVISVTG